jgi:hypothetical protein
MPDIPAESKSPAREAARTAGKTIDKKQLPF